MGILQDTYYNTITNPTDGTVTNVGITEEQRQGVYVLTGYRTFNTVVVLNSTDQLLLVRFNDDSEQQYPIPANGGKFVTEKGDNFAFSTLHIVNSSGSTATGTIHVTYGRKR